MPGDRPSIARCRAAVDGERWVMKKLLIGIAVLVVVAIVAVIVVPGVVPVDVVRERLVQHVRDATGRELSISGKLSVSVLPRLEVEIGDVALGNAPWAKEPQMITLSKILVGLKILPLLSGEVAISRFVLVEPVIHLEVDKKGRRNWVFRPAGKVEAKAAPGEAPAAKAEEGAGRSAGPAVESLRLGDVRLVNGTVTYFDAASGQNQKISAVNVRVSLPDLDSPLNVDGDLSWNGQTVDIGIDVQNPRQLLSGEETAASVKLSAKPLSLTYQGRIASAPAVRATGDVALKVPSVRELAEWTGQPIELGGSGLGPFSVTGRLNLKGSKLSLVEAQIALDRMQGNGNLSVDTGKERPLIGGKLQIDTVDLNPYLGGAPSAPAAGAEGAPRGEQKGEPSRAKATGPAKGWSDEPLDFSALKAADVDFDLAVGGIRARNLKIGPSALRLVLTNGVLTADLTRMELYGGAGRGRLVLNGRGKVPAIEKSFSFEGVQARPLLADSAGIDWLEGTARADVALKAVGRSERAMVAASNGKGAIKLTSGAIHGVNFAAMVRNVETAFLDAQAGKAQETDFAEVSATFTIRNGILTNNDLKLLNPLLRLSGAGTVDLRQRTVDYRVVPKLVGTLKGQGGETAKSGITVPVIISGEWDNLSFRPDLAGIATEMLKNPAKAAETIKGLGKGGGLPIAIPGAGGGEGGGAAEEPAKALKKLFGN